MSLPYEKEYLYLKSIQDKSEYLKRATEEIEKYREYVLETSETAPECIFDDADVVCFCDDRVTPIQEFTINELIISFTFSHSQGLGDREDVPVTTRVTYQEMCLRQAVYYIRKHKQDSIDKKERIQKETWKKFSSLMDKEFPLGWDSNNIFDVSKPTGDYVYTDTEDDLNKSTIYLATFRFDDNCFMFTHSNIKGTIKEVKQVKKEIIEYVPIED